MESKRKRTSWPISSQHIITENVHGYGLDKIAPTVFLNPEEKNAITRFLLGRFVRLLATVKRVGQ